MRDYSFGNFISALRERQGLSQYQLGALVGVSDKAVSKWENGAAVPRINTIKKLSEVLEVNVEELLTCEYAAFDNKRKDLFVMKNEIINIARSRMYELYGENPPLRILNRFNNEELMLKDHEMLLWMGFFGKLQEEFYEKGYYFEIRGAQMGASFIAWLLGGTNINPLPPHYYCQTCKTIEFVKGEKAGIDLADKKCVCGRTYNKDGFGISEVNMYPLNNRNEISISANATNQVKQCLQKYFEGYGVVRELNIISDNKSENADDENTVKITRFILLSKDIAKRYPEKIINIHMNSYYKSLSERSVLTMVENVNEKIYARDLVNLDIKAPQMKKFIGYVSETEIFKREYLDSAIVKMFSIIENPKFSDLISMYGFLYGTNVWTDNAKILLEKGIALSELICCREDVYAYIYDKLNSNYCENPSGLAFEIKEAVGKGKYTRGRMPIEIEHLLLECEVPEWYVESMKNIRYLFPKTNLIVRLKRDICEVLNNSNML